MPDQITTAAALEYLLFGLNEDGHEPYLLVVDSRPKPALVWLREAASEEVQAGVTIGEPGLKHFTDGLSRNQTLDWLKYPVTVLYRPDAPPVIPGQNPGKPTAEAVADALIRYETGGCCGFGKTCGLCDCGRSDQTAEQRREWDEHQLDRARAVLALIPQRCVPSEDELAKAVTSGWVEGFDEFGKYGPQFDSALAARAVLALFGDQLRARADSRYTYGVWTRHDGQKVPYRKDALALDPDEALRFHAFPAECGCYPLNTDNREWACEHGATWTRGSIEPYGKPTTGPIYPYGGDR